MKKWIVIFIAGMVLFNAGFDVYLRPLLYTLTPLQRYYLGSYLASSWHENDPSARTEVQLIWKVGPKRKRDFATEQDLFPIPAGQLMWKGKILPFWMTQQAEAEGWKKIEESPVIKVNSVQLAGMLREDFYSGFPAWRFFVQPALMLAAALILWLLYRANEARYFEQNWWKAVPLWVRVGRKVLASGSVAVKSLQAPLAQLALPTPAPGPVILEQTAPQPKVKPASVPSAAAQVQAAKPAVTPAKPKTTFWDESKGLD